jgi:predicted protein tyrosine phosphatase
MIQTRRLKLTFICAAGHYRSKKAAEIFSKDHDTNYFGIAQYEFYLKGLVEMPDYTYKALYKKIFGSDLVFVMEDWMKLFLLKLLKVTPEKDIIVLNIEDIYVRDDRQAELEKILIEKITPHINEELNKEN